MQFGQQKEVKFSSVKTSEQNIVMDNKKDERESKSGSRDSKSMSKEVQSGQLAHAICNMTETLASYKVFPFACYMIVENTNLNNISDL